MKKLIMIAVVMVIGGQALALRYPDDPPPWRPCCCWWVPRVLPAVSGLVLWEFLNDGCMPTSDEYDPYEYYDGTVLEPPTFGTRYQDSGPVWTWSGGVYTVNDEDAIIQPIPKRSGNKYLTQYLQVVHTMVESTDPSLIGLGIELWNMEDWPGCPEPGESIDGYIGVYDFPEPDISYEIPDSNGWYKSIWVSKFSTDGSYYSGEYEEDFPDLYNATHTTCIIGMDDFGATGFQIEEIVVDFVWHDTPQVPECSCPPPPCWGIVIDTNDIPIYEPQDAGGPPAAGPTEGQFLVSLAWRPGYPTYPPFTAKVVIDPNREDNGPAEDFSFPASTEPNGVVRLTFTEANWNVPRQVHVAATKDILREGNESFIVELTVTIDIDDPNFDGCHRPTGIIVVDNDIPYIMVEPDEIEGQLSENDPCVPKCFDVRLSHSPTDDVHIFVERKSEFDILLESMSVMDPNHLLFTPGNYNTPQQICLEARDDDELVEEGLNWVPGTINLWGLSDDIRYQSADEGGELDIKEIGFNVQDNECGAWGYDYADLNHDCYVNLGDVALFYSQWLMCVQPYGDGCDKLWNLFQPQE